MNDLLALASGVIVTGFDGVTLDAPTREALAGVPFAGYILFARNLHDVAATRALTDDLRSLCAACADPRDRSRRRSHRAFA